MWRSNVDFSCFFLQIKLCWNIAIPMHLHSVCDCFCANTKERTLYRLQNLEYWLPGPLQKCSLFQYFKDQNNESQSSSEGLAVRNPTLPSIQYYHLVLRTVHSVLLLLTSTEIPGQNPLKIWQGQRWVTETSWNFGTQGSTENCHLSSGYASLKSLATVAFNTPWWESMEEMRKEVLCTIGKKRTGLQIENFRKRWYEPNFLHLLISRKAQKSFTETYAPHEDLQDLELTTKKDVLFIISSVQLLSRVWLFVTPWTEAHQASLSITNSWSLLKLMSIELVMPSNHLILCHPLLLLPSIFPNIKVFSRGLVLRIRWPKYSSFSFSINPSNVYPGLISSRIVWFDLLAVQGYLFISIFN